jgi:hypothetical protein
MADRIAGVMGGGPILDQTLGPASRYLDHPLNDDKSARGKSLCKIGAASTPTQPNSIAPASVTPTPSRVDTPIRVDLRTIPFITFTHGQKKRGVGRKRPFPGTDLRDPDVERSAARARTIERMMRSIADLPCFQVGRLGKFGGFGKKVWSCR